MNDEDGIMKKLGARTREFAVRCVRRCSELPKSTEAQILGKQLLRSGTSVGTQCREASRARLDMEVVSKIELGLQQL